MVRVKSTDSILKTAHDVVAKHVSHGDTVIDATAGNGHDTLFLAGGW